MNVLWLCNIPTPDIASSIGQNKQNGGGWIVSLYHLITKQEGINLYYLFPNGTAKDVKGKAKANYFGFKLKKGKPTKYNKKLEKTFKDYLTDINPDIIHVFGTEFAHHLALTNAAKELGLEDKIIVSIQGLCSFASKHYTQGLLRKTINSWTFRDFVRFDNIKNQQKAFKKRGAFEIKTLLNTHHIAGRTTWDKACTAQINLSSSYHHLGETLRENFYKNSWNIKTCKRHAIFISTAEYPIKGAHYMLRAMPQILEKFPDAHLYISGEKLDGLFSFKDKLRLSSYPKYILSLIKSLNLKNHVTFLGSLDEKRMANAFLNAHVFVSPSVIENSPNSVGEAMLMGVPVVASDVGGVSDMVTHKKDGFIYNSNAAYMLSFFVCEIFGDDNLAVACSNNAKKHAAKTHDKESNFNDVLTLYRDIIK